MLQTLAPSLGLGAGAPVIAWLGISLPELGCFLAFWAAQVGVGWLVDGWLVGWWFVGWLVG